MTTLSEIRRQSAQRIRDIVKLTATDGGSMDTLVDELNLLESTGGYVACWGIVVDGHADNVGRQFRVTASSASGTSISFQPALPQPIAEGDLIDLHNLMGKGFKPQDYLDTAIAVVAESYPDFMVPIQDEPGAFDGDTGRIACDETLFWVYDVQYEADDDSWVSVPPARWEADLAEHEIVIRGNRWRDQLDGETIRLRGYGPHPEVAVFDDEVLIFSRYVVAMTAARLARRRTGNAEWQQAAGVWEKEAAELTGEQMTVLPNNSQRVR